MLFVVSVPIGDPDDITLRALSVFKKVDFVICEELKPGRRFLKSLGINKELYELNEHNEESESEEILELLLKGRKGALFSDAGSPGFADPGHFLVRLCHDSGIRVTPVPGASSLTAALSVSGIKLDRFHYAGFLPRQSGKRRVEIRKLASYSCPVIIYDTPYRLPVLLKDVEAEISDRRRFVLLLSLTSPKEKILTGSISEILLQLGGSPPKKKEFVLIMEPPFRIGRKKNGRHSGKRGRRERT